MTKIYNRKQITEIEQCAIRQGISEELLMQRAGAAAFEVLLKRWPRAEKIIVICGRGNNAGDGYIVSCLLKEKGLSVDVLYLAQLDELKGAALVAARACEKAGVNIRAFSPNDVFSADVIVDALLGTGIHGEVAGNYELAIEHMNQFGIPILAIDVPSGLEIDTGQVLGAAVRADVTMTFIGLKPGLLTGEGPIYAGDVICDDLKIPRVVLQKVSHAAVLLDDTTRNYLKPRERTANKGNFGHVLVVGGDKGMTGAVHMAAEAAARVGAGLVSIATRSDYAVCINEKRPEIMCHGVEKKEDLESLLEKATVVVIGPGLGRGTWGADLLSTVLRIEKPLLIDADGLNLLAELPSKGDHWILTPHPGEANRLLKISTKEVQKDRFKAIQNLQKKYGGVCVLKGTGSLILGRDDEIALCNLGNPGMATGGMGDVLSGVIGGLLAQGLTLEEAARLGVYLHAKAGDLAAQEKGERGLLAMDLMPYLQQLVN